MTDEPIYQALEVLRKGGIILYPTDTVWGIGCDATNDEAVERIYRLKRSGEKKSMLVLLDNPDKVSLYIRKVPDIAWQLYEVADKPLTLILPGACAVAENLIPEEGTLGIRIPEHEFCKKLIRKLNRPLVSTSANISGQPAPRTYSEISQDIRQGVDLIVDARRTSYAQSLLDHPRKPLRRSERNPPVSDDRNENPNALCRRRYAGTRQ